MGASKPSMEKVDVLTPEQTENIRRLNESTGGMMNDILAKLGYDMEGHKSYQAGESALDTQLADFDPGKVASTFDEYVGQPARQKFEEQTIPGIAERYSGRGSGSQLAMGGAATDFERNLAAQKSQTMLGAEQQKEQIRSQGINQALQYAKAPGDQGMAAIDRYLGLVGKGQTKQYDVGVQQGSSGMGPDIIAIIGQIIAALV